MTGSLIEARPEHDQHCPARQGGMCLGPPTCDAGQSLLERADLTFEERHEVEQFLLPNTQEIAGILGPDWVEPRSLKAKKIIRRLLGMKAWAE